MKKLLILWLIISACSCTGKKEVRSSLSLSGQWMFRIDSLDAGIRDNWFADISGDTIKLPGSMAENGKGNEVTVETDWTGQIVDSSYFSDIKYEKYRQKGNIKIPFWLKPVKYYKGAAWYQKEFDLPEGWENKNVVLFLERPHWESTVFVNGKKAGTENSLAVPHQFEISDLLHGGKNLISIRIDNRVIIPIGINSHSISDHTQSDWNGIAGDISLRATSKVYISNVSIYPDIKAKIARVRVEIKNKTGQGFSGNLSLTAKTFNDVSPGKARVSEVSIRTDSASSLVIAELPMGNDVKLWDEFNPSLYKMEVSLEDQGGKIIDEKDETFGMREFRADGSRFAVNGRPVFLRGTTECCVFPLTGYPPVDEASWEKIFKTCRDYGLNHMRFHSYCPPEAAFDAADKAGFYFHVECSSWANSGTSIGDGATVDQFIYDESDRIIREYGNHPSFCMLAYGNEPAGNNQNEYLGKLIKHWKAEDNRRVYTSAAGWPAIPENDYNLTPEPRIQAWGAGLKSIINAKAPQTMFDFDTIISRYKIPVVSHEIGQWCVYPDFKEIEKYTGILKATNLDIFRESLNENNMGDQAEDFLMASGKLQVLCYKADVEAALRTRGFAGFEILQLHDFPGQGTALVGILNPFFESKGYVTPEEFRMFCSPTVPLARMSKLVYRNNESFSADLEIAHFGQASLKNISVMSKIFSSDSTILFRDSTFISELNTGNCIPAGSISMDLSGLTRPQKLTLVVSLSNSQARNSWEFWVYPVKEKVDYGNVLVTGRLGKDAENVLRNGGSVLLLTYGKVGKNKGAQVAIGFSSIFWNTAWTHNQPPHTLGILCDPRHPVFREFPTEFHSNWQWWDPVTHSQAMIIDSFPGNLRPLIQPIDTWFENRRLALAFEAAVNGGKLFVCSIDLENNLDERPVAMQLLSSVLNYMKSKDFNPATELSIGSVRSLMANEP